MRFVLLIDNMLILHHFFHFVQFSAGSLSARVFHFRSPAEANILASSAKILKHNHVFRAI